MDSKILTIEGFFEHKGHQVWWGAAGADELPGRSPVIVVHGGPGLAHDYLEPFAALADGRRVVFYDQYGCGRSDRATDPMEYDIGLFVEELEVLRQSLGLTEAHIIGHSYGGPLVLEYVLSTHGGGVRSLVLSNTFASAPALREGWARRHSELSESARLALDPELSDLGSRAYNEALGEFVSRFVLPIPAPEPLMRSQAQFHTAQAVYARMHGPSWFEARGQWASWDVSDQLHKIDVPTLLVSGVDDQCVPALTEVMHAAIPGSEMNIMATAHLPFYERPDEYFELLRRFLVRAEQRTSPV